MSTGMGSEFAASEDMADRAGAEMADAHAEIGEHSATLGARMHQALHSRATLGSFMVLLLAGVFFSFWAPHFLAANTFSLIIQQTMVVGTVAIAQAIVVLTAGIDLSVGSILVLTMMLMAKLASSYDMPGIIVLIIGLAIGAACGFINGFLITRLKLPPFIVTLGTLSIFFSLNLYISKGQTVNAQDMTPLLVWTGKYFKLLGTNFTYGSVMVLMLFLVFSFILANSAWGRHIYATGDDVEAARLAGIQTNRVLLSAYTLAGLICAVGAWMLIGRIGAASPQSGQTLNLDSITAVVVGGISLFGGRGKLIGVLFGTLIVGFFETGLKLGGVDVLWQRFAVGALVVAAVAIDQWIRKVQS